MITLARETRGLTQSGLADKLGITQGTLSKLENQQAECSDELLRKLSQVLSYPPDFFEREFTPGNLPPSFFRRYKTLSGSLIRRTRAELNIVRLHVHALVRSAELPINRVPVMDPDSEYDPEQCASDLRAAWRIPPGPINDLTGILEDNGIVIVSRPFRSNRLDGISTYDREIDLPPIVLINTTLPGDRLRFTLAHELAHIVLHSAQLIPHADVEKEAHHFAAELLMPAVDIQDEFPKRLGLRALAHLKARWGVSIQALIMRAEHVGKISDRQKRMLFAQMSRLGYRRTEPIEIPRDEPKLFRELIDFHLSELDYTQEDLCRSLSIEPAEFQIRYINDKPFLRLLGPD